MNKSQLYTDKPSKLDDKEIFFMKANLHKTWRFGISQVLQTGRTPYLNTKHSKKKKKSSLSYGKLKAVFST